MADGTNSDILSEAIVEGLIQDQGAQPCGRLHDWPDACTASTINTVSRCGDWNQGVVLATLTFLISMVETALDEAFVTWLALFTRHFPWCLKSKRRRVGERLSPHSSTSGCDLQGSEVMKDSTLNPFPDAAEVVLESLGSSLVTPNVNFLLCSSVPSPFPQTKDAL